MDKELEEFMELQKQIWQFSRSSSPKQIKGATILQFIALRYLCKNCGATMGDLADSLGISISSATQLVERMVLEGLIKREEDSKDRRKTLIKLTNSGEDKFKIHAQERAKKMKEIFSHLSKDDLGDLIRINKKLILELKK